MRICLLSPAYGGGKRARMLLEPRSAFATARTLAAGRLTLGEAYTFMSGLYFRGKLAYGAAFGESYVITPTRGLIPPDTIVTAPMLREFAAVDIATNDDRFRRPFERDIAALAIGETGNVVLLGSVATGKYVDSLMELLGDRLLFPGDFVGRGDMSRGGLMLRRAREGKELEYIPVAGAVRHGPRPPKLSRLS